jgi:hypothetical protein
MARQMRCAVLVILSACFHDPPPPPAPLAAQAVHHRDVATTADRGDSLSLTALEPHTGDAAGGTYVRITGTHFIADGARSAKVYFGAHQGAITRFASDTELIVEAPGGTPDEVVDVVVIFEPGGEMKLPHAFRFVSKRERNSSH